MTKTYGPFFHAPTVSGFSTRALRDNALGTCISRPVSQCSLYWRWSLHGVPSKQPQSMIEARRIYVLPHDTGSVVSYASPRLPE